MGNGTQLTKSKAPNVSSVVKASIQDVAVPIVFPDYRVLIEETNSRVPLGHAGILFIEGKSGITKYFEYGRYDAAKKGLTRKQSVPNVKMVNNKPSKASLTATLRHICKVAGGGTRIMAAYIELDPGAFNKMNAFCEARLHDNTNPSREEYNILTHSCNTFVHDAAEEGGAKMPMVAHSMLGFFVAPSFVEANSVPRAFILAARMDNPPLDYTPSPESLTGAGF